MKSHASFWKRACAMIIDIIFLYLISVPFYFLLGNQRITFDQATLLPRAILATGYFTYFTANGGQTLGKMLLKIKVVSASYNSVSYMNAFLRAFLGKGILGYFVIGYFWMLLDKKNQTWHDKIGDTYVVNTK